jgi:hypothetical protein
LLVDLSIYRMLCKISLENLIYYVIFMRYVKASF